MKPKKLIKVLRVKYEEFIIQSYQRIAEAKRLRTCKFLRLKPKKLIKVLRVKYEECMLQSYQRITEAKRRINSGG